MVLVMDVTTVTVIPSSSNDHHSVLTKAIISKELCQLWLPSMHKPGNASLNELLCIQCLTGFDNYVRQSSFTLYVAL
jgi:hypothetical protein